MLYNRILLTGANGLIGQQMVARFSQHPEYDLLATGRDTSPRYRGGSGGYIPLDITSRQEIRQVFLDFAPNLVINCAAMTQVDACEQDREQCWKVNAKAVECLVHECKRAGARFIQLSTDFVFDGEEGPYSEEDRPHPVNFYGRSKLAAENTVRSAGLTRWAIVRTALVFGTGHELPRSNFALWVARQLQKGKPIQVVQDQWRTPTYALDVAAAVEKIVRFGRHGVYHVSGRELVSIHEFARIIAKEYELDASLIHPVPTAALQEPATRPPRTGFIILKAETELSYKPHGLPHALRHLGARIGMPVDASS